MAQACVWLSCNTALFLIWGECCCGLAHPATIVAMRWGKHDWTDCVARNRDLQLARGSDVPRCESWQQLQLHFCAHGRCRMQRNCELIYSHPAFVSFLL